jgi:hypothetical protein
MIRDLLKTCYRSLPIVRDLCKINHTLEKIHEAALLGATVDAVRLADIELKAHPRYGSKKRLLAFEAQVNSENGEDGMIQEVFNRIGVTNKVFVDIGVGDGVECNSAFLLARGWQGYWIDGNPRFLELMKQRADLPAGVVKPLFAFINRENIRSLFEQLAVPTEFDFLSLDIDQNTYYAWEGLKGFRPRAVLIEYNSAVPPDIDWKAIYGADRVWDGSHNNYGASLKALELLGRTLGYSLVGCDFNGVNAFFVRTDLVGDKFEAPYTAENHYEPPRFALSLLQRAHQKALLDRNTQA